MPAAEHGWKTGIFLAIGGTFLFALKSIFIKLAYFEGASTDEVLFLRMVLAAPFYLVILILLKTKPTASKTSTKALLAMITLGFLGYYLASYLDIAGLQYITAQLERLTLFTYPALISLLAWLFLGEKISRLLILAIVLCYLGLTLMYGQEKAFSDSPHILKGMLLVLGSALSYSLYVILSKPLLQKHGSSLFTSIAMLASTVFVIIHFFVFNTLKLGNFTPKIWAYCLALAFLSTVLPSYMIAAAITRIGAARTSILGTAGPLFTILLAVWLINEPFSWTHVLGIILILTGVTLVSKK